ncbi:MAG: hypothetical protein FJ122_06275 [Deltaproteobacteria bacterium]|nr:hypothetical protein [Deltaproteobacteria bacterium]
MPSSWQSGEGIINSIKRGLRIDKIKTGRVGHLADKYRPQIIRYRTILQGLFGGRQVECYLLFIDEPHRILTI